MPRWEVARLDCVLQWPGRLAPMYIDVSVRHPTAKGISAVRAAAAAAGERTKLTRYGRVNFLPLVFEGYGRLGDESLRSLTQIVQQAALSGGGSPFALRRWRVQLERSVLAAEADLWLLAMGASAGVQAAQPQQSFDGGHFHVIVHGLLRLRCSERAGVLFDCR